jgi:type VI secretion system protein ImpA
MPLRDDLLNPIAGENPSGIDLRYENKLLVFDKIKEARRQDDNLDQGDWQTERKTADYPAIAKLAQETLAKTSKDLQLAAYLTEALLNTASFTGLREGLDLTLALAEGFWETIYPPIEDDDRELRAGPLAWLGTSLALPIRTAPICREKYSTLSYTESRRMAYEDKIQSDKERETREKMLAEGKMAPEVFDKAFNETPKAFYVTAEKELDASLATVGKLESFCEERLGNDAPSFQVLKGALTETRQAIHTLLMKKRETEPDPVEASPAAAEAEGVSGEGAATGASAGGMGGGSSFFAIALAAEPPERRQIVASIVGAAQQLRRLDPVSPTPYLLLRGLRWGELRTAARKPEGLAASTALEAPSTELRQQIKLLALAGRWSDLLEAGEMALAVPGARAWLDLQRLQVAACSALGEEYSGIATAIQSELRALLNDLPELLDAALLDESPAANPETKAWIQGLGETPSLVESSGEDESGETAAPATEEAAPGWLTAAIDAFALAKQARAKGQEEKAFAIMRAEIARQSSGRGRFRRTMQLAELAIDAGKDALAQPLLEDLAQAIEDHKLDAWEEPQLIAADLSKLMRFSQRIKDDSSEQQRLYGKICRLDPVRALGVEQ